MIGIVIVAHGGLAREYLSAMEHVVGKKPGAIAIPIGPEDDVQAKQDEISQAVVDVDQGDGVIVVTDLVGSTPSNLAVCACTKANQRILYGVNMPMLIKLGQARNMTIDDAVSSALTSGRKYINSLQGFGQWIYVPAVRLNDWRGMALRFQQEIVNTKGLHARASAKFVEVVDSFDAKATVSLNGIEVPGDSIMGLMSLGASWGTVVDIEVTGPQEHELAQALRELVSDFFREGS